LTTPGLPPWAVVSQERRAHIERVADLLRRWADALGVDSAEKDRWLRAAYLHDALRDADPALLKELAPRSWGVPALLHGPAAAAMAERDGEKDRGVLDAVRYHSVGYSKWDRVGRMLYLADYLDPGRGFETGERQRLAERVVQDPDEALRQVVADRLVRAIESGKPLMVETVELWNALVGGG
jgi:HD superfamily phosphohydrolase YqeK